VNNGAPSKIKFDYLKSGLFRTVKADGVYGGPNANRDLVMSFFSERSAIPKTTVHAVKPDGTLGDEIVSERVSRDAVIREIEVCVSMSLATAKVFHTWLDERIRIMEGFKAKK
jgi:hypothetical protein